MKKLNNLFLEDRLIKILLYLMPAVLFFSYFPVIPLGANENMNFELSVPLVWLLIFDVVGAVMMMRRKILFKIFSKKWAWLVFPVWLTLSVIWSANVTRGILTAGMGWLVIFAIYVMWGGREILDDEFRSRWWKWFFGAAITVSLWCVLQCILDLVGVSRNYSLMCAGCTYHMFGFPHPNGFAIEPQFMGNLLLTPALAAMWFYVKKSNYFGSMKRLLLCFFIFTATLFLTFSRGAIYAFGVGMLFMTGFILAKEKKRELVAKRFGVIWSMVLFSFVFTLNVQGVMAELGPTSDTYGTGVAKVLNHLSLGVIDIKTGKNEENLPVEKPVENFEGKEEATFDGYVAESTDTRVKLTNNAIMTWSKNLSNAVFGVGLGGTGQALFDNGLTFSPKEIVQNEYASLLLETGIIGVLLLILCLILLVKNTTKSLNIGLIWSVVVCFGVSLCFFSGLPNALHVYLLPAMIYMVFRK